MYDYHCKKIDMALGKALLESGALRHSTRRDEVRADMFGAVPDCQDEKGETLGSPAILSTIGRSVQGGWDILCFNPLRIAEYLFLGRRGRQHPVRAAHLRADGAFACLQSAAIECLDGDRPRDNPDPGLNSIK